MEKNRGKSGSKKLPTSFKDINKVYRKIKCLKDVITWIRFGIIKIYITILIRKDC